MTQMIIKQLNYAVGSLDLVRDLDPPRDCVGSGGCPPSDEILAEPGVRLGMRITLVLRLGGDLRGDNASESRFKAK